MALPAIDSFEVLAGALNDYSPVVDPTTDLSAFASNTDRADMAGITRIAPRIVVVWNNNGSVATQQIYESVIGNGYLNYPTIVRIAAGVWQMVFPPTCVDLLGSTQYWNFRWQKGSVNGPAPASIAVAKIAPTQLEVRLWDQNNNPSDLVNYTVIVEVY